MKLTFVFTLFLVLFGAMMASAKEYCLCPLLYRPVCGVDGKTYSSSCSLECAEVELAYEGICAGH